MKRLLLLIPFLAIPAFSDINVTPGVGKTVGSYTDPSSREIQQTSTYIAGSSNTVIVSSFGVFGQDGVSRPVGYGTVFSSVPVNVMNVASVTINGQLPTGTNSIGNIGTVAAVTAITNALPAGTNSIGAVTTISTVTVVHPSTVFADTVTVNGIPTIQGAEAAGTTATKNPIANAVVVSSDTLPTTRSNGQVSYWSGDTIGRGLVTGMPWGLITVSTAILTTDVTEKTIISSAAAGSYTYLCGCTVVNTSATGAMVTIRGKGPVGGQTRSVVMGAPASFVGGGIWPGCTNPFFRSDPGSNITVQGSASVSSIEVRCISYQGP